MRMDNKRILLALYLGKLLQCIRGGRVIVARLVGVMVEMMCAHFPKAPIRAFSKYSDLMLLKYNMGQNSLEMP